MGRRLRRVVATFTERLLSTPYPLHHLRIRLPGLDRLLELDRSLDVRRNVRLANHSWWRSATELLELERNPPPLTIVPGLPP